MISKRKSIYAKTTERKLEAELPNEQILTLVGYAPKDLNTYNQYVGYSSHTVAQEAYEATFYKAAKELALLPCRMLIH